MLTIEQLSINNYDKGHRLKLTKNMIEILELEQDDELDLEINNHSIILTKVKKELPIEESVEEPNNFPSPKKERKEQMSIVLTPTNKMQIRQIAEEANTSVSELIGYWIEQTIKSET